MADQNKTIVNISASSSLGIEILVSKHTYLVARIPIELIADTYLQDLQPVTSFGEGGDSP